MSQRNTSRFAAVELLENRRLLMGGITDTSFGNEGVAFTPVDSRLPAAIARQPDGKLLVAGIQRGSRYDSSASRSVGNDRLTLSRYNADGTVDTSFGPFGVKTLTDLPNFAIVDFLPTPEGGLLLRGVESDEVGGAGRSVLIKIAPGGTLDTSFGADGRIDLAHESGGSTFEERQLRLGHDGRVFVSYVTGNDSDRLLHIRAFSSSGLDASFADQGTLKVLSAGGRYSDGRFDIDMAGRLVVEISDFEKLYIRRYSPGGEADSSIGTMPVPVPANARLQAILADNRMVFSRRYSDDNGNAALELYRITVSGKLDSTFSGDGKTVISAPRENEDPDKPLLIAPDGRVVYLWSRQLPVYVDDPFGIAVVRTNGTLDPTFGGDGVQLHDLPFSYPHSTSLLQPDGKLVISGASFDPEDFALVRYGVDGKFDKSFDKDGIVLPGPGNNLLGEFNDVKVLADGRSVAVGRTGRAGFNELLIARYTAAGALDTTFAGKGWTKLSVNKDNIATQVLVQSDGKYLVGGAGFIVRYKTDGALDPSFGTGGVLKTNFSQMQLLADGKILLVDGGAAPKRLNTNGSTDSAFAAATLPSHLLNTKLTLLEVYPGNRLLVGGLTDVDEAIENRGVLLRYNANGALDTTFSGDGIAFPKATDFDLMAVRPDGGINVVHNDARFQSDYDGGYYYYRTEVWQLKSNGKRDMAFGPAESATDSTSLSLGYDYNNFTDPFPNPNIGTSSLRVSNDGSMLLGVRTNDFGYIDSIAQSGDGYRSGVGLIRLTPGGKLDPTFSANGLATIDPRDPLIPSSSVSSSALAFAVLPNGGIVAAGAAKLGNTVPLLTKFEAENENNVSMTDGGQLVIDGTPGNDTVAVDQTQDIVTVTFNGSSSTFDATRLNRLAVNLGEGDDRIDLTSNVTFGARIEMGAGNDTVVASNSGNFYDNGSYLNALVFGGAGDDEIQGTPENDRLEGGEGNDIIRDVSGANTIRGGTGNDRLNGGRGYDELTGEDGDDTIYGGGSGDYLFGGDGADYLSGDNGDDSFDITDNDTASGGDGNDGFTGNAQRATLMGAGGDDTFRTNANDATPAIDLSISGGPGNDMLLNGELCGRVVFIGGPGSDTANFNHISEPLNISLDDQANDGRAGDAMNIASSVETVVGGTGNDRIVGSAGNNVLFGNTGSDVLHGMAGDDTLVADFWYDASSNTNNGRDSLFGGDGDDTLISFKDGHKDRIDGGAGNDKAVRDKSKDLLSDIELLLVEAPDGVPRF